MPTPYTGFHKDPRQVRVLWERFNAHVLDVEACRAPYQRLLVAEWQRCTALGVDVAMTKGRRLSSQAFEQCRRTERLLIETSVPIIRDVGRFLDDVPGIMILSERNGTILHISGDESVREQAAELSGIVVSSQWNEATAGTNGMGTALALRQPVHVFGSEHFCEGWHAWSCAASPIFDSDGQTVLGIVDFTAIESDFRDQALGLAVSVANTIQAHMALHRELERRRVLIAFGDAARQYPHDDLLALDHAGRVLAHSPNERCRQAQAGWGNGAAADAPPVRHAIEVRMPAGDSIIGRILLLAKPAGYQRVFSGAASEPPARSAEPVARFGDFVTCDPETRRMLDDLARLAQADVNLLIVGETGTGKDLLARQIHALSRRSGKPCLAMNCGAISEHLMESTLFGYVRGAFSGADPRGRAGYFESAGEGTLFLDEVGELPLSMQSALLRVLEDGSFQRVGSCETRRAACRIIAATHRDLEQMVRQRQFRQDLYFRLCVVRRDVKPLRERRCDIPLLAEHFASAMARKHGLGSVTLTPEAIARMTQHAWPGNAREMRNALEAAVLRCSGVVDVDCLPAAVACAARDTPASARVGAATGLSVVRDCERELIIQTLARHPTVRLAADALGMARSTLYRKFSELGIRQGEHLGTLVGGRAGPDHEAGPHVC